FFGEIGWPRVIPVVDTPFKGPCLFPREQHRTSHSIIQPAPADGGLAAAPLSSNADFAAIR
ncbi:MAG: hypothetical protein KAI80_02790, partial [Hyphomicrobiaceae bacterium]|nr:hypothetical protein [Hyphomicrobiaceae bacterium]